MTVMKSGNFQNSNPPTTHHKNENFKNPKSSKGGSKKQTDIRNALTGPDVNASGPFPPDQRPIQCFKCRGWEHVKRLCSSWLNYMRGNAKAWTAPSPNQESTERSAPNPEQIQ